MKIDWNKYPDTHPEESTQYLCTLEDFDEISGEYTYLDVFLYITEEIHQYWFKNIKWEGEGFYYIPETAGDNENIRYVKNIIAWAEIEPYEKEEEILL